MITCKEDLIGTYVDGSDVKLGSAYQELLFKFGVKWLDFDDQEVRVAGESSLVNHFCFDGDKLSWNSREFAKVNYKKELTEHDLKPKPTKFVKVEDSIFDLKEEFERGELFTKKAWGEYVLIEEDTHLASLYEMQSHENSKIGIYRQVEIDWRDEVKSKYSLTDFRNLDDEGCINLGDWTPEGFIKICHFVAELTDKPE